MIRESAQVIALDGDYALVQTQRRATCESCAVNKGCGTSVLAKVIGRRYAQIRVLNVPQAKIGDTVIVGMGESGLLKSALLVYCLPLLAVVLFVMVGSVLLGPHFTDGMAIVFGVAGFGFALIVIKLLTAHLIQNPDYQPAILTVEPGVDGPKVFAP
jgi:sigma-E factor negative regulatory protein RseC